MSRSTEILFGEYSLRRELTQEETCALFGPYGDLGEGVLKALEKYTKKYGCWDEFDFEKVSNEIQSRINSTHSCEYDSLKQEELAIIAQALKKMADNGVVVVADF